MVHTVFDDDEFRREVREAARKAFAAVTSEHAGERFYAFALYSDDGAMTVAPAANTEEGLRRRAEEYGYSAPDQLHYLRWATGEWAYEGAGADHFRGARALLTPAATADEDDDGFDAHRGRVFDAVVGALEDLDHEGFFGTGHEREAVALIFSVTDSDEAHEYLLRSARRLNPETVYQRIAAV